MPMVIRLHDVDHLRHLATFEDRLISIDTMILVSLALDARVDVFACTLKITLTYSRCLCTYYYRMLLFMLRNNLA